MGKIIQVELERCIGCRLCEVYCAVVHGEGMGVERSRIRVNTYYPGVEIPNVCFHCNDAPCRSACPVNAIAINSNFVVEIDNEKCVGCRRCVNACPAHAIFTVKGQKSPIVCDMCSGKPSPTCVEICPTNALVFAEAPFDGACYARDPKEKVIDYCKKNNLSFEL